MISKAFHAFNKVDKIATLTLCGCRRNCIYWIMHKK